MSIKSDVLDQIKQVAREQNRKLATLADNLPLLESGLDSLCFAIVIARLEDTLGVDPFSAALAEDERFPLTVGELVNFYERAAK